MLSTPDITSSISTRCYRSEKYDSKNCRALPVTPKYFSNITNEVSWSIVSNAADKSSRTRYDYKTMSWEYECWSNEMTCGESVDTY